MLPIDLCERDTLNGQPLIMSLLVQAASALRVITDDENDPWADEIGESALSVRSGPAEMMKRVELLERSARALTKTNKPDQGIEHHHATMRALLGSAWLLRQAVGTWVPLPVEEATEETPAAPAAAPQCRELIILDELRAPTRPTEKKQAIAHKTHGFPGLLYAAVEADGLWEEGGNGGDNRRPVFAMLAMADAVADAFVANIKFGRMAVACDEAHVSRQHAFPEGRRGRYEWMRGGGYAWYPQRHMSIGVKAFTVLRPDLCRPDPGMIDPEGVRFVAIPRRDWSARVAAQFDVPSLLAHMARCGCKQDPGRLTTLVPLAALAMKMLDHRTNCPAVVDPRFYLQVLVASLERGFASLAKGSWGWSERIGYRAWGLDGPVSKFAPGLAFMASHKDVEKMLAEQVILYRRKV